MHLLSIGWVGTNVQQRQGTCTSASGHLLKSFLAPAHHLLITVR
jgi:hypothetical protein